MGAMEHILGGVLGTRRQGGVPVSPCPLAVPQGWMTPTSTDAVWRWLTSTGTAEWTSCMATGMGRTASTCRVELLVVSDSG